MLAQPLPGTVWQQAPTELPKGAMRSKAEIEDPHSASRKESTTSTRSDNSTHSTSSSSFKSTSSSSSSLSQRAITKTKNGARKVRDKLRRNDEYEDLHGDTDTLSPESASEDKPKRQQHSPWGFLGLNYYDDVGRYVDTAGLGFF